MKYKTFLKNIQHLHGVGDAGTIVLFKYRSRTHGLHEELGMHKGREGRSNTCYVMMSVNVVYVVGMSSI